MLSLFLCLYMYLRPQSMKTRLKAVKYRKINTLRRMGWEGERGGLHRQDNKGRNAMVRIIFRNIVDKIVQTNAIQLLYNNRYTTNCNQLEKKSCRFYFNQLDVRFPSLATDCNLSPPCVLFFYCVRYSCFRLVIHVCRCLCLR